MILKLEIGRIDAFPQWMAKRMEEAITREWRGITGFGPEVVKSEWVEDDQDQAPSEII